MQRYFYRGKFLTIHCSYRPVLMPGASPSPEENLLARVRFGEVTGSSQHDIETQIPLLPYSAREEIWTLAGTSTIAHGVTGRVRWSESADYLWFCIEVGSAPATLSLQASTRSAYAELLALVRARKFPRLARLWNYFADINAGEGDQENYRQFCLGRQQAFYEAGFNAEEYPAASALGRQGSTTIIYGLATREPCVFVENPQQTSAYAYPREFGPASPSFARATLVGGQSKQLWISGTASIVRAESLHQDDVVAQARLSCRNIDLVLARARDLHDRELRMDSLKIYLRHGAAQAQVTKVVADFFPAVKQLVWLRADICRRELLVEIEGIALHE